MTNFLVQTLNLNTFVNWRNLQSKTMSDRSLLIESRHYMPYMFIVYICLADHAKRNPRDYTMTKSRTSYPLFNTSPSTYTHSQLTSMHIFLNNKQKEPVN